MLIEYKIKFDEDGVTVSQRIEPDGSTEVRQQPVSARPAATQTSDAQVAAQASLASAHNQPNETSSTTPAARAVLHGGGDGPRTGSGGGDGPRTGTGGGGAPSTLIVVFGPVVIGNPSSVGADAGDGPGGGDGPKTGTGT